MEEKELDETLENIYDEIFDINEEIANFYKDISYAKLANNNNLYKKSLSKLKNALEIEKNIYKKLTLSQTFSLLKYLDYGELRNRFSIFDKFYNLAFQYYEIDDEKKYRILNYLRDRAIMLDKISKFDDEDIYSNITQDDDTENNNADDFYDEEKDMIFDYENKMLNTLLVEFQLFSDLLRLFICSLNYYIKCIDNAELKENLINYKNIILFTYAKEDSELLDDNINFENTFIYSKLIYDMLLASGRKVAYSYEIIKREYLDKSLYEFFINFYNLENIKVQEFHKIIQKSYLVSLLMLYQNNLDIPKSIFSELRKINYDDSHIESLVAKDKTIVSNAVK